MSTSLADRIRECATIVGSGAELARRTHIPRRSLGAYLAGRHAPKPTALAAIARVANVNLEWLTTGLGPRDVPLPTASDVSHARFSGHLEGTLYEDIYRYINDFAAARGRALPMRLHHRLAEENTGFAQRYDDAAARQAVVEVLAETRVPAELERPAASRRTPKSPQPDPPDRP